MIPVFILDPRIGDFVLDMCAAPGSKSCQIIEHVLSQRDKFEQNKNSHNIDSGLIVVNELDSNRAAMLAHQTLKQNCENLVVTNRDSTTFPKIVSFDKIICDVPCSGDGTIRKNNVILKNWTPKFGNNLFNTQLQLLLNSLYLLKQGGTMAYSTCSLNPIENEAVIAQALKILQSYVELVEFENKLGQFKTKSGLLRWKNYYKNKKQQYYFSSFEEVPQDIKPSLNKLMFWDQNCLTLNLDKAKRVYPHQNNTGGFFIAQFKKNQDFEFETIKNYFEINDVDVKNQKRIQEIVQDKLKNMKLQNFQEKQKVEQQLIDDFQKKESIDLNFGKLTELDQFNKQFINEELEFCGITSEKIQNNLLYACNNEQYADKLSLSPKRVIIASDEVIKFMEASKNYNMNLISCGVTIFMKNRSEKSNSTVLQSQQIDENITRRGIVALKSYKKIINVLGYLRV